MKKININYDLNEQPHEFDSQIKLFDEDYLPESYSNEKFLADISADLKQTYVEEFNYGGYDDGGYY